MFGFSISITSYNTSSRGPSVEDSITQHPAIHLFYYIVNLTIKTCCYLSLLHCNLNYQGRWKWQNIFISLSLPLTYGKLFFCGL